MGKEQNLKNPLPCAFHFSHFFSLGGELFIGMNGHSSKGVAKFSSQLMLFFLVSSCVFMLSVARIFNCWASLLDTVHLLRGNEQSKKKDVEKGSQKANEKI